MSAPENTPHTVGLSASRVRWRRWLLRGSGIVAALALVGGLVLVVIIVRYGQQHRAQPADVIIVLGGGAEGTERRATHGAALYHAGYAPVVLCTGGVDRQGVSEALRCARTLVRHDVPAPAIALEEYSYSTEENAIEARAIMQRQGWHTAVLVSDSYHLWRARWLFEERGITVYTSPAQRTSGPLPADDHTYSVLREVAAVVWHAGKSALGLPYTRTPAQIAPGPDMGPQ